MKTIKKYISGKVRVTVLSIGLVAGSFGLMSFSDEYFEISKNLEIFTTLFREVNINYVDEVKNADLMKTGIDAMLDKLDPYTQYIPESDIENFKMHYVSAEYGGVGALVFKRDDNIVISEPYEGFPAQRAGIQAGDIILEINGISVKGKSSDDVSGLMKGQRNTTVRMKLQREGESAPLEFTMQREEIKLKDVPYFGVLRDSIGYIKLNGFLEASAEQVKDALVTLKEKEHIKGVVLDLRGNGGGILQEAVKIVNLFVKRGEKVVVQKGKSKDRTFEYRTQNDPIAEHLPLVVLVDKGSASASEIVAGAIQDLDRGVIIGERSFGKGLVQQTFNLPYNSLVKVTVAKYYTPSGRCIQKLDYTHRKDDGSVTTVPDSLMREFKTVGNRLVYDGNGIYPDIAVTQKKYSTISVVLGNKYFYFDYASKYKKSHKTIDSPKRFHLTEEEYVAFANTVSTNDREYTSRSERSLNELKKYAEQEEYLTTLKDDIESMRNKIKENKKKEMMTHKQDIKELLEAEIVSRYYYENGRTEIVLMSDNTIAAAINAIKDKGTYASVLKGEGSYKVIGKPKLDGLVKAGPEVLLEEE